ncbi:MAG: Rid family hydrolase [Pseudomonadota bacterium]
MSGLQRSGLVLVLTSVAMAFPAVAEDETVARDGRTVTFSDAVPRQGSGYDSPWHYAHAVRAGDFVHVSGIIIAADRDDELPIDRKRFAERTGRVFERLEAVLATAGASVSDVVKINTFHVLDGRNTALSIDEQALVIAEVRAKYAGEPHSAWTAVGTTGLFSPRGIVEIEVVAYVPR